MGLLELGLVNLELKLVKFRERVRERVSICDFVIKSLDEICL